MAGTEASGTGNMKLALNGALTIGTMDGANIEICDAVGRENIFIFGHTADEVDELARSRATGRVRSTKKTRNCAWRSTRSARAFSRPTIRCASRTSSIRWSTGAITTWCWRISRRLPRRRTRWMQRFRDQRAWAESAIENVAGMGQFSSDRTIGEYARNIWHVKPLETG